MKIAVDAMSGDNGLESSIPAIKLVLSENNNIKITLVGIETEIKASLDKYKISHNSVAIYNASEVVTMDDAPAVALRYKKDSSMRKALDLVKLGLADACVSAGNTGALMAMSKFVLKTIHGIDRPAIASQIPTYKGRVILLDLGANVNCTAVNLYQFALMGSILSKSLHSVRPKVALLNIGQESQKGTEVIKEASNLVANNKDINYIGYIEADKIYDDIADVIVCDGFIGNVALKTSEGLSRFISDIVWQGFNKNFLTKMLGLLTMPVINKIRAKLDVRKYNGASFLGLNGIVIKSHGGADGRAFANAIMRAKHEIETNVIEKLKDEQNKF